MGGEQGSWEGGQKALSGCHGEWRREKFEGRDWLESWGHHVEDTVAQLMLEPDGFTSFGTFDCSPQGIADWLLGGVVSIS